MSRFVLTCQLALAGPGNIRPIVQNLQRQLSGIQANIQFRVNPAAVRNLTNLNSAAGRLNQTLTTLTSTANSAVTSLNNLSGVINANARTFNQATTNSSKLGANLRGVASGANESASAFENLGKQAAVAIKRYAAFSVAAGGIFTLASAIKSGLKEALDFQNEIVKLSQVTGYSIKSLGGLSEEVTRLATTLGVSSKGLLNVSQTLAQAGYTADEVKVALEALAKTELAPTFKNIENTTEGAIAAMKQFDIQTKDLEKTLGSMNAVAAGFAVESDDLVTAIRRSGAAFKASGGTLNEFIALFTSVRQTTRESAETIATGFRTIFTRLQRPKTIEFFKSLGVELTDAKGNFIGAYEATRRLSEAMSKLDSTNPEFAKVVEELGGFRQVSKVIPLLQQFAVAEKALGVAIRGQSSLTKDAETAQQSFQVQITKVKEEFLDLFRVIGADTGFQSMVKLGLSLASSFIQITKAVTPLIPLLSGLFALKVGAGLTGFSRGFGSQFSGRGPRGFARGGIVPGSGNGDTVPAMLEPGEFVMTKKAVQGIGHANLAKANKYAGGGLVKEGTNKEFGLAALFNGGASTKTRLLKVTAKDINKDIRSSAFDEFNLHKYVAYEGQGPDNPAETVAKREFEDKLLPSLTSGVRAGAEILAQKFRANLGENVQISNLSKIPNYEGLIGSMFEAALGALGNPFDSDELQDDKRPIDFPQGLNIFKATHPMEAKRKLTDGYINDMKGKIATYLLKNDLLNPGLLDSIPSDKEKKEIEGKKNIIPKDERGLSEKELDILKTSFPGKSFRLADAERVLGGRKVYSEELAGYTSSISKGKYQFKANGGSISGQGTDTVPAMLTPGEFVISKKSAQKIGYGNLNKMNKVHKYANGGVVQHFATGGQAQGGSSGADFGKIYLLTSILPTVAGQFFGLNEGMMKLVTTASAASIAFGSIIPGLKKFDEEIANSKKAVSDRTDRANNVLAARTQKNKENYDSRRASLIQGANGDLANIRYALSVGGITPAQAQAENLRIRNQFRGASRANRDQRDIANNVAAEQFRNRVGGRFLEQQQTKQSKAFGNKVAGIAQGAGIVAGIGGAALQDFASKDIRNNQGINAIGGALSGAGTGAAAGAFLGPFGAAIGAAIGGIYGFVNATQEAAKMIEKEDFDKSFSKLESSISKVASGKSSLATQSGNISFGIQETRKGLYSGNKELRTEAQNRAQGQSSNFEAILQQIAASSSSIVDFENHLGGISKEMVSFIADINGISVEEVKGQFEKQIKAQENAIKVQKNLTNAQNAYLALTDKVNGIVEAFEKATKSVAGFDDKIDSIISSTSGNLKSSEYRNDFSGKEGIRKLATPLGSQGSAFVTEIEGVQNGIKELPKRLAGLAGTIQPLGDEGSLAIENAVSKAIEGFPDVFKDVVLGNLGSITGKDNGTQDFLSGINISPKDIADKLTKDFGDITKALEEAGKIFTDRVNKYSEQSLELVKLDLSIREQVVKGEENSLKVLQEFGEKLGKPKVTSKDITSSIDRNRNTLVGGKFNVNTAGAELNATQRDIDRLTEQRNNASGAAVLKFTNEINIAKGKLNSLHKVLQDTANSFDKLNAISKELADEEAKNSAKRDIFEKAAFGGPEETQQIVQAIKDTERLSAGGNLLTLDKDRKQGVLSLAKSLGSVQNAAFGKNAKTGEANTGDEFIKEQLGRVAVQSGLDPAIVEKSFLGVTSKEEELKNEMIKASKEMQTAQTQLQGFLVSQKSELATALSSSAKEFATIIEKSFLNNLKEITKKQIDELQISEASIISKKKAFNDLGGTDEAVGNKKRYVAGKEIYDRINKLNETSTKLDGVKNSKITDFGIDINQFTDKTILGNSVFNDKNAISQKIGSTDFGSLRSAGVDVKALKEKLLDEVSTNRVNRSNEDFDKIINNAISEAYKSQQDNIQASKTDLKELTGSSFDDFDLKKVQEYQQKLNVLGQDTANSLDVAMSKVARSLENAMEKLADITNGVPQKLARGGTVYASKGMFAPKGTDTVPAMLTPGEFVVNAKSAQKHRGLLEQINTQYKAAGGVIQDPVTKLWKASGGAKLSKEQQKENLINRAKAERLKAKSNINGNDSGDAFIQNVGATLGFSLPKNLSTFQEKKQANIDRLKAQRKSETKASSRTYSESTNPQLKELGKIRQQEINNRNQERLSGDTIESRTKAGIELIKKQNRANGPNINGVAYVSQAQKDKEAEIKLRASTGMLNFNNQMMTAKYANTTINTDNSAQKKYDNNLDSRVNASANEARVKSQADEAIYRENNPLTGTTGGRGYFDVIRDRSIKEEKFVPLPRMKGYAEGGSVDSVPAMLTPGEFVLNRSATTRAGLGNLQRFNRGGSVGYYNQGGTASGGGAAPFNDNGLSAALNGFKESSSSLITALNSFPRKIELETAGKLEVIINGAEVLNKLQEPLQEMVSTQIASAIQSFAKDKLPGIGPVI